MQSSQITPFAQEWFSVKKDLSSLDDALNKIYFLWGSINKSMGNEAQIFRMHPNFMEETKAILEKLSKKFLTLKKWQKQLTNVEQTMDEDRIQFKELVHQKYRQMITDILKLSHFAASFCYRMAHAITPYETNTTRSKTKSFERIKKDHIREGLTIIDAAYQQYLIEAQQGHVTEDIFPTEFMRVWDSLRMDHFFYIGLNNTDSASLKNEANSQPMTLEEQIDNLRIEARKKKEKVTIRTESSKAEELIRDALHLYSKARTLISSHATSLVHQGMIFSILIDQYECCSAKCPISRDKLHTEKDLERYYRATCEGADYLIVLTGMKLELDYLKDVKHGLVFDWAYDAMGKFQLAAHWLVADSQHHSVKNNWELRSLMLSKAYEFAYWSKELAANLGYMVHESARRRHEELGTTINKLTKELEDMKKAAKNEAEIKQQEIMQMDLKMQSYVNNFANLAEEAKKIDDAHRAQKEGKKVIKNSQSEEKIPVETEDTDEEEPTHPHDNEPKPSNTSSVTSEEKPEIFSLDRMEYFKKYDDILKKARSKRNIEQQVNAHCKLADYYHIISLELYKNRKNRKKMLIMATEQITHSGLEEVQNGNDNESLHNRELTLGDFITFPLHTIKDSSSESTSQQNVSPKKITNFEREQLEIFIISDVIRNFRQAINHIEIAKNLLQGTNSVNKTLKEWTELTSRIISESIASIGQSLMTHEKIQQQRRDRIKKYIINNDGEDAWYKSKENFSLETLSSKAIEMRAIHASTRLFRNFMSELSLNCDNAPKVEKTVPYAQDQNATTNTLQAQKTITTTTVSVLTNSVFGTGATKKTDKDVGNTDPSVNNKDKREHKRS